MEHGIFLLGLLFTHGPTFRAEGLFPPFQKLPAAHPAILRLDPPELRTGIAIGAASRTAFNQVPVLTHEPLPVRVITQIIQPLSKQRVQN